MALNAMKQQLCVFLVLMACTGLGQQSPVSSDKILLTEQNAYLVGPPNSLSGTTVLSAKWSPTGRHLIVQQASLPRSSEDLRAILFPTSMPQIKLSVQVVDVSSGENLNLLSYNPAELQVEDVGWSPDGSTAFLITDRTSAGESDVRVSTVAVPSGAITPFAPWGNKKLSIARFFTSPDAKTSVLVARYKAPDRALEESTAFLFSGGKMFETKVENSSMGFPQVFWTKEGGPYLQIMRHNIQDDTVMPATWLLSLTGGPATEVELQGMEPPQPSIYAHQVRDSVSSTEESGASVESGWLKSSSSEREVLVAANTSWIELSPANDCVAYIAEGALFVRPLLSIGKDKFDEIQAREMRQQALQQAKQVGIAAAIFATDNEDRYPTPNEFKDVLGPYMKNPDLMKNFVWTFAGGDANLIKNPSQTELGYIALPGGRAVVYADTSARWIPN